MAKYTYLPTCARSSHTEVFCKRGVLKNVTKFIGKHLCQSLFFNKVAVSKPATLLKRDPGTGVFLFKNAFFTEHFRWLFLMCEDFIFSQL